MIPELTDLLDVCGDLVSQKSSEAFLASLFSRKHMGQWTKAAELGKDTGFDLNGIGPDVFVTWVDDPSGDPTYALVLFFDDETKLTAAAQFNRSVLSH
jgi:hypothetical protein